MLYHGPVTFLAPSVRYVSRHVREKADASN